MPFDFSDLQERIEDRHIENYDRAKRILHRPDLECRLDEPEPTTGPDDDESDDA